VHIKGEGREASRVTAIAGSNTWIFQTDQFEILSGGSGNINEAPFGFSVSNLTWSGNYLKLDTGLLIGDNKDISWRTADTILNSSGGGMRIFGSGFDIDVEAYNLAENALYCEATGSAYDNKEYASRIRITGRISGKEAIIWRGPGDIFFEYIVFGLAGLYL
jgi:hypothetical protein